MHDWNTNIGAMNEFETAEKFDLDNVVKQGQINKSFATRDGGFFAPMCDNTHMKLILSTINILYNKRSLLRMHNRINYIKETRI